MAQLFSWKKKLIRLGTHVANGERLESTRSFSSAANESDVSVGDRHLDEQYLHRSLVVAFPEKGGVVDKISYMQGSETWAVRYARCQTTIRRACRHSSVRTTHC